MVSVTIMGVKETLAYFNGFKRRTKFESNRLPSVSALIVKASIKRNIITNQTTIGAFHRMNGTGLAASIQKRKQRNGSYIVRPNPNLKGTEKVLAPAEYVDFVEFGTKFARARHYFRDGVKNALLPIGKETVKSGNNIVKK